MTDTPPVILIGLDAAEIDVVERLVADGRMPNLARLRQQGRWGRLRTEPPHFLSLVWSTFFCGTRLGEQGWYFNKIWNPDLQRLQYVDPAWLPVQPFWLSLDPSYRLAILDLPYATALPTRPNMTTLNGWQCHDDFGHNAVPAELWARLSERHGKPRMTAEVFGPQSAATLLAQRQEVLDGNPQFADICRDLLTTIASICSWPCSAWCIAARTICGTCRRSTARMGTGQPCGAGRKPGRQLRVRRRGPRPGARGRARPMRACVVFALHGMGPNDGWYEFLPRILERIHRGGGGAPAKPGLLFRLRQALPWTLVRQVTRRIPAAWNKALVPLWSRRMHDWPNTKYFALPMDYNGTSASTSRDGRSTAAWTPGTQMGDRRGGRGAPELPRHRHRQTGDPGHDQGGRADSPTAPRRRFLPDLVVLWDPPGPAWASRGVVSDQFGEIRWPKGRKLASGRSGNHTPHGWFVAKGPGIRAGTERPDLRHRRPHAHRVPVARRAGPSHFAGRPIEELLGD